MSACPWKVGDHLVGVQDESHIEMGHRYEVTKIEDNGPRYPDHERYIVKVFDLDTKEERSAFPHRFGKIESDVVQRTTSQRLAGALPRRKLLLIDGRRT